MYTSSAWISTIFKYVQVAYLQDIDLTNTTTVDWTPSCTNLQVTLLSPQAPPTMYFQGHGSYAKVSLEPCVGLSRDASRLAAAADHARILAAENTGSDGCLEFFLSQFTQCQDSHNDCRLVRQERRQAGMFMPTRTIDVGPEGSPTVNLSQGKGATNAPYIALSHCWGNTRPLELTQKTYERLKSGIAMTLLPKTFQDAIVVARKLQVQYLWIDSL